MEPSSPTPPESTGTVDENSLVPMGRDWRFVFRLVSLLVIAGMSAAFVGYKLQRAAAGCGASLVRPGASVIPPGTGGAVTETPGVQR